MEEVLQIHRSQIARTSVIDSKHCSGEQKPKHDQNYVAAFQRFERWVQHHHELSAFPASPEALYLLSLGQSSTSVSSINQFHFAVIWVLKTVGFEDPTSDTVCFTILQGVRCENRREVKQKSPLTPEIISKIRKGMICTNRTILLPDYRLLVYILLSYAAFLKYDEASRIRRSNIKIHTIIS